MYIHCQIRQRSESQRICGSDLSNKRVLETGQGWVSPRQGSGSGLLRFRGPRVPGLEVRHSKDGDLGFDAGKGNCCPLGSSRETVPTRRYIE